MACTKTIYSVPTPCLQPKMSSETAKPQAEALAMLCYSKQRVRQKCIVGVHCARQGHQVGPL